jgi:hypothetical protein
MTDAAKEMLELADKIRWENDKWRKWATEHDVPEKEVLACYAKVPVAVLYKAEAALRSAASAPSQAVTGEAREEPTLLCDVFLPPATILRKGVKLSVLMAALSVKHRPPIEAIPSQAIVAGGVRAALEHARVRFECLAEEFDKAGDNASWAMCSVDAERMSRALALPAPEPQREE